MTLDKGGWEIVWAPKSPHGILACSFVSEEDLKRSEEGSSLKAGRFFMYHRVWTRDTLESERQRRREIQAVAAQSLSQRDEKVQTLQSDEENFASKAKAYAEAVKSMNDYHSSGMKEARFIPLYDDQVLEISPECIVSTRGLIYQREERDLVQIGDSRVDFLKQATQE